MLKINLKVQNIVDDCGARWLSEIGSTDPLPPKGMLLQSIAEARARLVILCNRFLLPDGSRFSNDELYKAENIVLLFDIGERRAANKAQSLGALLHSYLVNAALTKVFSSTLQADIAAKHDEQAKADASAIDQLLRSKVSPA